MNKFIIFGAVLIGLLLGVAFNLQKTSYAPPSSPAVQEQPNQTWVTFENDQYSFSHPSDIEVEHLETADYSLNSLMLPDKFGHTDYRNLLIYTYDLSEFSDLNSSDPIDVFAYAFYLTSGELPQSIKNHIYSKSTPTEGDFDAMIILDGSWWQGSGAKTAFVKVADDSAIVVWIPMYWVYEENEKYVIEETPHTEISKKIIESFKIKI